MQRRPPLVAAILSICICAAASLSLWSPTSSRTEDRNGDGRPDVWRTYDRQGRLSEVAIDTNFDGRSDVREHYESGSLISREFDRNFDDRVDLVQQFDQVSHEQVRSIEDVDYDGTADLLVLFQGGTPVFSKWAHSVADTGSDSMSHGQLAITSRSADDPLTSIDDPFRTDFAISAVCSLADSGDSVGSLGSAWLPTVSLRYDEQLTSSASDAIAQRRPQSVLAGAHSPRGPPASRS